MSDTLFYLLAVPFALWQLHILYYLVRTFKRDKARFKAQRAEWARQDALLAEKERALGITPTP